MWCMTRELDDHEDLLLFILRESMTQRRLWKGRTEWSWMAEEFVLIILSLKERTHLHQAFTWADQLIVVVEVVVVAVAVEAVADVEIHTMIEDMIVDMTDTKIMTIGTEEGRLLLIIVDTDRDQDRVPTAHDAIDNRMAAVEDVLFS